MSKMKEDDKLIFICTKLEKLYQVIFSYES